MEPGSALWGDLRGGLGGSWKEVGRYGLGHPGSSTLRARVSDRHADGVSTVDTRPFVDV